MSPELNRAEALLKAQSWQAAHDAFRDLVDGGPEAENPDAVHDWAICCFYLDQIPKALDLLDRAVILQPDYGYRYASRAWMRAAAKQYEGAMADYRRAIELDPEDAVAQNNLGLLEEQAGYRQQAQERFRVADELQGIFLQNGLEPERPEAAPPQAQPEPEPEKTLRQWMRWAVTTTEGRSAFIQFIKNGLKTKR
jgi:tetratricopeptide (TPR) repeat protein